MGIIGGSGGYLDFILTESIRRVLGEPPPDKLHYHVGRNKDFKVDSPTLPSTISFSLSLSLSLPPDFYTRRTFEFVALTDNRL